MESKRKDLEIVYNLQWKNNRPGSNGDNNKMSSSIVGMYDIPSTTLNWDSFKSYLLKNSGTTGDDVKVSYVIDDKEFSIESQIDFQIALYSFRNRARQGEIINLKLDRVIDKKTSRSECVNAHTQVDCDMNQPPMSAAAPDWFRMYMKQFKKEIIDEVTSSVVNAVTKQSASSQYHRKAKVEPTKRSRKHTLLHFAEAGNEKELIKSKLERKLENKLEKLEHKTLKIKEKKQALSAQQNMHFQPLPLDESDIEMDATPNSTDNIHHVTGGMMYQHTWKVINSGNKQWDSNTELRYAWGSQLLVPLTKNVACPSLKPGEEGTVVVILNIPTTPGHYECYWHFYHNSRRFGHWLGCQIIVEPHDDKIKEAESTDEAASIPNKRKTGARNKRLHSLLYAKVSGSYIDSCSDGGVSKEPSMSECMQKKQAIEVLDALYGAKPNTDIKENPIEKVSSSNELQFEYSKLNESKSGGENICSSDSDNQSLLSFEDSNSSVSTVAYDEFVLVPMANVKLEPIICDVKPSNVDETVQNIIADEQESVNKESDDNNNNTDNFVVVGSSSSSSITKIQNESPMHEVGGAVCKNEGLEKELTNGGKQKKLSEYAFVMYKGQKLPVPKKYLHADYLATAEDAPDPKEITVPITQAVQLSGDEPEQEKPKEQENLKEQDIQPKHEDQPQLANSKKEFNFILDSKPDGNNIAFDSIYDSANTGVQSYASHCSAVGSCFSDYNQVNNTAENDASLTSSRLFVFPSNCPGYEVVYPGGETNQCQAKSCNMCASNEKIAESAASVPCNNPSAPTVYNPTINANNKIIWRKYPHYNKQSPVAHSAPMRIPGTLRGDEGYQSISVLQAMSDQLLQESANATHVQMEQHMASKCTSPTPCSVNMDRDQSTVHILPETLVTGAVNVASSAINTARSVLNMIVPTRNEPGVWVNGHWVAASPETPREAALRSLAEMGFWDRDLNATLLARYNDDLARVVTELVK